jgi:uncharacterized protein
VNEVKIDISTIIKNVGKSIHVREKIPAKQFKNEEFKLAEGSFVDVDLTFSNLGTIITVKGSIEADLILNCSRCLIEYPYHLSVFIEEDFYNQSNLVADYIEEKQLDSNDLRTVYYSGEAIDLFDMVRENILVNIPIKPVCNEACKGICPQCGRNLNEEDCRCRNEKIDLRLEVLKKLLPDEDKSK